MSKQENKTKREKGITLVALIITIVIIVILSSVTISATFGDNGIIKKAELARDLASNATIAEAEDMNSLMDEYSNIMKGDGGIPEPPKDTTPPTVDIIVGEVTENSIAIAANATDDSGTVASVKYYLNGEEKDILSTNTYTFTGLTTGTEYEIKVEVFDEAGNKGENSTKVSTKKKEETTDGSYNQEKGVNSPKLGPNMRFVKFNNSTKEWIEGIEYSYIGKTTAGDNNESKWANAEVTTNGVKSYFVWIPRYAYKINSNNQTIDVKFIKDTGNIATDGTICKYVRENPGENDYIIHPAFTNDVNNGGWDSELPGIWIGKYETSGNSSQLKVQPGVQSLRNTTISNMFIYAKNYSTNLNSHMLKNSEWGAVAYLTHSKYGRNKQEVTMNDNLDFYTGGGNNKEYLSNVKQSSTGNVYGIYDLSGGSWECVGGAYKERSEISTTNGSTKYGTVYTGMNVNSDYKKGDATYEVKGWKQGYANFVDMYTPFFLRGGASVDSNDTDIFEFNCNAR